MWIRKYLKQKINVLIEYMNLEKLTNQELLELLNKKENEQNSFGIKNQATKLILNSMYGACGSSFFRYYDLDIAEGVTHTGQFIIQFIEKELNAFLNTSLETKNKDYVCYVDTDSIVGDSLIHIDGQDIKIEDFYKNSIGSEMKLDYNNKFVKYVSPNKYKTKSFKNEIIEKNVKYVMKHEVEKEMYEIEVEGRKVIITEDHSLMVERNGKLIECKPKDILSEDLIIYKYT